MTMSISEFWPSCLEYLQEHLTADQYAWAGRLTVSETEDAWIVYAKNDFVLNVIRDTYLAKIVEFKEKTSPKSPPIELRAGKGDFSFNAPRATPKTKQHTNTAKQTVPKVESHEHQSANPGYEHTYLKVEYTFDTLVVGQGNKLANAVATAVADDPGKKDYNPLFIYGCTGLGKTHLVQAIGNRMLQKNPNKRVRYIHADKYISDYMRAVRQKKWDDFKNAYHSVDLLILDDVQFIAGKEKTMEEFFHLFNRFLDESKQIILTSDQLPSDIDKIDDRLKSRFSWGLSVEIKPPELEMRVAILQKKAEAAHFRLPEETAFFIAQNIRSNVRDLEGALNRVRAHCRFSELPPSIDMVKNELKDLLASGSKQVSVEQIQKVVADFYQIKITDMRSRKRQQSIVLPRQIAMSLARDLTTFSLPAIGEAFGGRDHTTVMHALEKIEKLKNEDVELVQNYALLSSMLSNWINNIKDERCWF